MNPFDILILIITGFCLIRGIFRGLIKELSSIVGVMGGFYAAYTYYPYVARVLTRWVSNAGYLNILSFLGVFCAVFLIISILGVVIRYLLNIAFLGWMDRICGAVFGLIKAVLISSVLLIALTAFLPKGAPVVRESILAPHVTTLSEHLAKVASPDMKRQFRDKIRGFKDTWKTR